MQSNDKLVTERIEEAEREQRSFLDLSFLKLYTFPPGIAKLTTLTSLNLSGNELTTVPPAIAKLAALTSLNLHGNLLRAVPPAIAKLAALTSLNLRNNHLRSLPPAIAKLIALTSLDLSNNQFMTFPAEITKLRTLTSLDLSDNKITTLPPAIAKLAALTSLDLSNNKITTLPPAIAKLIALTSLRLQVDALLSPPPEIARQGFVAVRTYFEALEEARNVQLFEAKLLIVGQGNVGKTYLMNRLIHGAIDADITSTEGIAINRWEFKTEYTDHFQVNFWDFGGQEIYHATHQFFLTKRSLYLFVWEARTDADLLSFDYWLNTIKVLSGNSPVIVIQNKIDERKKSINLEGWKKRFPNIVEFHDVSAVRPLGIDSLKASIFREIQKLPHIGDPLPRQWVDVRQRLESLNESFISYSQYQEICNEFQIDKQTAAVLSNYYHDLGVFLHFPQNPILKDTVFLKPEWATNAVYKVTDNQQVKDNYGKFHFRELKTIWKDEKQFPLEKHVELVELMKNFELCFELPIGHEYIIPELLLSNQPDYPWVYKENLQFKYEYDFMPAGVMTRLIVITHDLVFQNLYWKDGAILTWENSEALIVKTDNRKIVVWLKGDERKTLLAMIRRHFDYIHRSFTNLEVKALLPCLCIECHKNHQPFFYPYQNLLNAQKKGSQTIQCQKSFALVKIDFLLGGIENNPSTERDTSRQEIRIFLSSSLELNEERREIELLISRENRKLHYQNIFLNLIIWEDLRQSFSGDRIQNYFTEKMLECDIVINMFFKKFGAFTKEEFDVAYCHFKKGQKPRYLYVYFKSGKVEIDEIDEGILKIKQLKNEIEDAEQIYKIFNSKEDLVLQLKKQLDLIVPELVYS